MLANTSFSQKKSPEGEVLPFCGVCDKRATCKKICPELEKALPKPYGGISGKKVKFFDPQIVEKMADELEAQKWTTGGGRQKKTHLTE